MQGLNHEHYLCTIQVFCVQLVPEFGRHVWCVVMLLTSVKGCISETIEVIVKKFDVGARNTMLWGAVFSISLCVTLV